MGKFTFLFVIILGINSFDSTAQKLDIIDFSQECLDNIDSGNNTLKTQVYAHSFVFGIYSLELIGIAGCGDDSAYAFLKGDTLFLDVLPWQKMVIIDGDTTITILFSQCACNHYLTYDIYGLQEEPKYVVFSKDILEVNNFKYKKAIQENIEGEIRLVADDCGFNYTYNKDSNSSNEVEIITRERNNKYQRITLGNNHLPIKIETSVDYYESFKVFVPN